MKTQIRESSINTRYNFMSGIEYTYHPYEDFGNIMEWTPAKGFNLIENVRLFERLLYDYSGSKY